MMGLGMGNTGSFICADLPGFWMAQKGKELCSAATVASSEYHLHSIDLRRLHRRANLQNIHVHILPLMPVLDASAIF